MAEHLVKLTQKEERRRELTVSVHYVSCGQDAGDSVLLVPNENEVGCFQRGEYIDQFLVIPGLVSADDGGAESGGRTGVAGLRDRLPGHRPAACVHRKALPAASSR